MTSARQIASQYGVTRPTGRVKGADAFRIICPAHGGDDKNLAIWDGDGGAIAAKCWSHDCSYQAIITALGIEYTYSGLKYERADGSTVERRRGPNKDMRGNFGSPKGLKARIWSVDNPQNTVVICEGEKAAHALDCLEIVGYTAAAWTGGAGAVKMTDFSLAKGRDVIIWPDADDEGRKAAKTAAEMCAAEESLSVKIVDTAELPHSADAADVSEETARRMIETATTQEVRAPELVKLSINLGVSIQHVYELRYEEHDASLPAYRLQINDRIVDVGGPREMRNQENFRDIVAATAHKIVGKMPAAIWDSIAQVLFSNTEEIYPGDPAFPRMKSEVEETHEWIHLYFEDKAHHFADDENDTTSSALANRSYTHEGIAYLFLADFRRWLKAKRGEIVKTKAGGARLRNAGWERKILNVKKADGGYTTRSVFTAPIKMT